MENGLACTLHAIFLFLLTRITGSLPIFNPHRGGFMKLTFRRPRTQLIGAGAFIFISTPAFALFGLGDVVFDPSVYGQAVAEVKQAIQMVSTAKAQFAAIQVNL